MNSSAAIMRVEVTTTSDGRVARLAATFFSVLACGAAMAFSGVFLDLEARARCEAERDGSGLGRAVALRALEAPGAYRQFLYHVDSDSSGYRAVVVVRHGPFAGDAWQRDAAGQVRHASDVCRDRAMLAHGEDS